MSTAQHRAGVPLISLVQLSSTFDLAFAESVSGQVHSRQSHEESEDIGPRSDHSLWSMSPTLVLPSASAPISRPLFGKGTYLDPRVTHSGFSECKESCGGRHRSHCPIRIADSQPSSGFLLYKYRHGGSVCRLEFSLERDFHA